MSSSKSATTKRMLIMLTAMGVVFGGLYAFQAFKASMIKKFMGQMAQAPQTVSAFPATTSSWRRQIEVVGSLGVIDGSDLALQVSGIVQSISFNSGDTASVGQTLLRLNAEDDAAKLASLEATAELYTATLKRDQGQLAINAVSLATLDSDTANLKNTRALVAQQKALLEQKTLRAPFAGRLGVRQVSVGQFLSAGTAIVTLQALDPIYAEFYLPQQELSRIKNGQVVTIETDAYPGKSFAGEISAINPKVESGTRNVKVRASMSNPAGRLLPGMFVKVAIALGEPEQFVTLPQTAIVSNPYGESVFIVKSKGEDGSDAGMTAEQNFVKTGAVRGDQVSVIEGVKEGDLIVTAGQLKLRNGSRVKIDNTHAPVAEASPSIVDR
jgi:membrane fusion protein, multidrug efflux system